MLGGMSFEHAVLANLTQCLAHDHDVRLAAETSQLELEKNPEYPKVIVKVILGADLGFPERQLAAFTLKKYIDRHWSTESETFSEFETSTETKEFIRTNLLNGLGLDISRLRVATAYCISTIASYDWPDAWPTLFDSLIAGMKSGNPHLVHGTMRVLDEFVREELSEQQIPFIVPVLLPELYTVFCQDQVYEPSIRARVVSILHDFIQNLETVKDEYPEAIAAYLTPMLPVWIEVFRASLAETQVGAETLWIRNEIFKTLKVLVRGFDKIMRPYLPQLLEGVWTQLVALRAEYVETVVQGEAVSEAMDSDGEVISTSSLVCGLFDLIQQCVPKRSVVAVFRANVPAGSAAAPSEFLCRLLEVALSYLQITNDQIETWESDTSLFIQEEEDEGFAYNPRIAVQELVHELLAHYRLETLIALGGAVRSGLVHSAEIKSASNPIWWRLTEACLLIFGRAADDVQDAILAGEFTYDLKGLFDHIVLESLRANDSPFLQGRALWFSAQFSSQLPPELLNLYVTAAVDSLKSPNFCVRVSGLRALRQFCDECSRELLYPHVSVIIEQTIPMAQGGSEYTVCLVLDTLTVAVKINEAVTAEKGVAICNLISSVWTLHTNDPMMTTTVQDLFECLASNKLLHPQLEKTLLPVLHTALLSSELESGVVAAALEMVEILLKQAPVPIAPAYVQQVFPHVMHLLLVTEDHTIMQVGQELLKVLVSKDTHGVAHWSDGTKSGLDYIMQFIAKLLHPTQAETAAVFVGDLISKLILKAGAELASVLPELLKAVAQRLATAQTPTFIQSLVIVFAHLIQSQLEKVVEFLDGLLVGGQKGLAILLKTWCEHYDSFQGSYALKVSATSLTKLFESSDPRIQSIAVRGDLVATTSGIKTRSQAKKAPEVYTSVPFPAKVIKLMLHDLINMRDINAQDDKVASAFLNGDGFTDDEDDDDEYGDSSLGSIEKRCHLVDLAMDDSAIEDEADDDIAKDPVFLVNLEDHILRFFKSAYQQNTNNFRWLCEQYLSEAEKQQLTALIQ
ncbi:armadillo-type protein [Polychytrium aggregatum]|uniref:armadillo-type protein n=1 Tax=Polychytrium aggregatum TaxID=110093 RepID=UPI0022FEDA26|nr:armadillo-type protein [Polychytrium aggregatum]XP_052969771.1 armadillo-type protein [Polychytrium aggregatum]KAI9193443.1 armadillo-type protein [Polychytrium aggregatum]KAI9207691.1 armadillo-type protein [Polychytrium aggregatum]